MSVSKCKIATAWKPYAPTTLDSQDLCKVAHGRGFVSRGARAQ
jgi:hypothetical protein